MPGAGDDTFTGHRPPRGLSPGGVTAVAVIVAPAVVVLPDWSEERLPVLRSTSVTCFLQK